MCICFLKKYLLYPLLLLQEVCCNEMDTFINVRAAIMHMDVVGCLLEKTGHKTENNNNHAHALQSEKKKKKKLVRKSRFCFAAQTHIYV